MERPDVNRSRLVESYNGRRLRGPSADMTNEREDFETYFAITDLGLPADVVAAFTAATSSMQYVRHYELVGKPCCDIALWWSSAAACHACVVHDLFRDGIGEVIDSGPLDVERYLNLLEDVTAAAKRETIPWYAPTWSSPNHVDVVVLRGTDADFEVMVRGGYAGSIVIDGIIERLFTTTGLLEVWMRSDEPPTKAPRRRPQR